MAEENHLDQNMTSFWIRNMEGGVATSSFENTIHSGGTSYFGPAYITNKVQSSAEPLLISEALEDFEARCRGFYGTEGTWMKRLPWQPEIPVESFYVNLSLEVFDRSGKNSLGKLKNHLDIMSALKPGDNAPRTVLLRGPGGTGKSTFLKILAYQWARKNSKDLGTFKGLLLYSLRDLKNGEVLADVINEKLKSFSPDNLAVPFDNFLKELRKQLLVILDGYDELGESGKREVIEFIRSNSSFTRSKILLATRSTDADDILKYFTRQVKITKLEKKSLNKIIQMSVDENSKQMADEVTLFLKVNDRIADSFQSSPLLMYSLCYVIDSTSDRTILYKQTRNKQTIITSELFKQVVCTLFKRSAKNMNLEITDDDINAILYKLGQLSLECLHQRIHKLTLEQLTFHSAEHRQIVLESGLFNEQTACSSKPECEMIHSVFMESLAAEHCNMILKTIHNGDSRKEFLLKYLLPKLEYSTAKLVVVGNRKVFLTVNFCDVLRIFVKHGSVTKEIFFLNTEIFMIFDNTLTVNICEKDMYNIMKEEKEVDLLREILNSRREGEGSWLFIRNFWGQCYWSNTSFCSAVTVLLCLFISVHIHTDYEKRPTVSNDHALFCFFICIHIFYDWFSKHGKIPIFVFDSFLHNVMFLFTWHVPAVYVPVSFLSRALCFTIPNIEGNNFWIVGVVGFVYCLVPFLYLFLWGNLAKIITVMALNKKCGFPTACLVTSGVLVNHVWSRAKLFCFPAFIISVIIKLVFSSLYTWFVPLGYFLVVVLGTLVSKVGIILVKKLLR